VVDAIKQAVGSFVSFTFSTKFVCRVNQVLTVIAVIQIQSLRQAFTSKFHNLMSRNVNTGCPKHGVLTVHYGVEETTVNVRKMFKKFYWT
jgi:hypothetical protein